MEQLLQPVIQYWQSVVAYFAFDTALLSEPDMIARFVLQLCLLICSAFFSSSETALFSLSRLDLQQLRKEQNPHSETIHELLDQPRRLIISILSGNELVNIAAAANMAGILLSLYSADKVVVINLAVMVPMLLLFGEVTPKTIAVSNPLRYSSRIVARPMWFWIRLIAPVRWAIRGIADRITTLLVGEAKAADNILQVDEFLTLVEQVAEEGVLDHFNGPQPLAFLDDATTDAAHGGLSGLFEHFARLTKGGEHLFGGNPMAHANPQETVAVQF